MKIKAILIISISLLVLIGSAPTVRAETLAGTVINQNHRPIPGLTVFLVHPSVGRGFPSVTDSFGRYFFSNVPRISTPYYIEIYWGQRLIYRNTIVISGNVQLPPIVLRQ
jgi:phosphoribulokinase